MKKIIPLVVLLFIACSKDDNINNEPLIIEPSGITIFENDPNGVNIVLITNGVNLKPNEDDVSHDHYRKERIAEKTKEIDYLFKFAPLKQYKKHFNVYLVLTGEPLFEVDAKTLDVSIFDNYISEAIPDLAYVNATLVSPEAITFDRDNDGTSETPGFAFGNYAFYLSKEYHTMVHEFGHAFCGLGDEYIEREEYMTYIEEIPDLSRRPNLDTTNDPETIKWSHFIGLDRYYNVGAYEGGYRFFTTGVWRPESSSIMGNLSADEFNAPSREAIVKRIYKIKNMEYTFEEFLENDVIKGVRSARKNSGDKNSLKLTNCIIY